MYIVSCRKNFDSNIAFSAELACRNFTNPANPKAVQDVPLETALKAASSKHVLVLVHGFNNPIANVAKSYWELLQGLDQSELLGAGRPYGLVIGFTWPGSRFGIGYFGAVPKANRSAGPLRDLLTSLRSVALSVDIQTHSLGARVALRALADPKKTFVDNLMLTAAAIDNDLLEPGQTFYDSLDSCNRLFVYHSTKDPVLGGAFWIGDVLDGIHPALGLRGPREKKKTLAEPNIYVVDCSARVTSHGGYRNTKQYYSHWGELLSGAPMARYDELG